ncbi:hypothetical protein J4402_04415 [Candidatus Pacearchaeota archaeon]|nr:hypothetical protein [Candidatus Pacearchaeota archaeon]
MQQKTAMTRLALTGLAALMASSAGCAFGNRHCDLKYENPVTPQSPSQNYSLSFDKFDDRNEHDSKCRAIIGCVRNGYGFRTAEVKANNQLGDWFKDALSKELSQAGYNFSPNSPKTLEGTVIHLYTDVFFTYNTKINLRVKLKDKENILYDGTFEAESNPLALFASESEYANSSEQALQNAMREIVPKLTNELKKAK